MSSTDTTIYTGFWINWSDGRVKGSTITLSAKNSAYLIAFLALFVRLAGGQLWAVLAFLSAFSRATAEPQDALYHQQQAILRNTSQPATVLWSTLKLSWFWKGTATKARTRTAAFIFLGLTYIAAFGVAGIFSSKISSPDSQVLLVPSDHCGLWPFPWLHLYDSTKESWQDYSRQQIRYDSNFEELTRKSHTYTGQCYNSTSQHSYAACLPYGRSRISWSTDLHAACPFSDDICIADAVQFDTGFLNSQTHFGINSRDDQVEYRRVMTCAPITTDGHVSGYVDSADLNLTIDLGVTTGETFRKYEYGPGLWFPDNTTFAYSNLSFQYSVGYGDAYEIYKIDSELSTVEPANTETFSTASFTAIPSLSRTDADTTLVFLSLNASYLSEIHDPWFRSEVPVPLTWQYSDGTKRTTNFYTANELVTVVACAEQHQLRNVDTGAASSLGGSQVSLLTEAQKLGFNEQQIAIYNRSFYHASYSILTAIAENLGGNDLLAVAYQSVSESTILPEDQWQLEFNHYFGIAMNTIQLWSLQYVLGPSHPEMDSYVVPPTDGFAKTMCSNQIVRRTDFRSFSVLGLAIIFAFGFLFILANLTIRSIVESAQEHTEKGRYRNAEWQANDFLQLQRMAYQHNNTGTWTGQRDMVPRTNPGEVFTLPESTAWNEDVPEVHGRDSKRMSMFARSRSNEDVLEVHGRDNKRMSMFTRSRSNDAKAPVATIAALNSSDSNSDVEPVVSTTDIEKGPPEASQELGNGQKTPYYMTATLDHAD